MNEKTRLDDESRDEWQWSLSNERSTTKVKVGATMNEEMSGDDCFQMNDERWEYHWAVTMNERISANDRFQMNDERWLTKWAAMKDEKMNDQQQMKEESVENDHKKEFQLKSTKTVGYAQLKPKKVWVQTQKSLGS